MNFHKAVEVRKPCVNIIFIGNKMSLFQPNKLVTVTNVTLYVDDKSKCDRKKLPKVENIGLTQNLLVHMFPQHIIYEENYISVFNRKFCEYFKNLKS